MKDTSLVASSPRRIRQNNEIAALQALHRAKRLSRADLARALNLNRSSSGHIIAELTVAGLVREMEDDRSFPREHARAGRPGVMIELVPDAVLFIGIEIGVEHITTVRIGLSGAVAHSRTEPFDGPAHSAADAIRHAVKGALADLSPEDIERLEGVGISTPSQLRPDGTVHLAPLLGWKNVNLSDLARQYLPGRVPVMVENDANAFAIGAGYSGLEMAGGVTLFVVMESGVGGGIVIDGKLLRGAHGLAGEIGHMLIPTEDGAARNLEEVVGLGSILTLYRKQTGRREASLEDFLADVEDRAPEAVAIAEIWAKALGHALAQTCRIIDPDRIVLGGSVAKLLPLIASRLTAHMKNAQEPGFPLPVVLLNAEANSGSAYGAACMLHQRYLSLESNRFADEPA
ncbi:Sugar kinase of the NBD/HSP70 family, may contain an N-terminal HTH domain [Rhizobium sp. RU20A]|uniref:ROK family transcriptional regulator n=1 Tax=Rhizobium sp. RU20A TaxID=1907412 RepID=UPI000955E0D2|nr:ROK family transcriptional regulator [Rhizobium sp. RU20A]SIQ96701.1 Sugar kinase of the NBD/HSP70 family, may contain an N-terminal HTH domain [Rhizobium sp. RU20A]